MGLYRLPDLIERRRVVIVEGEKSVDQLWSLDIPSTCPHAGAGCWRDDLAIQLWQAGAAEIVVIADADRSGHEHAQRVVASCYATRPTDDADVTVKLVTLPGLPPGGDVYDFLATHDVGALLKCIEETPPWTPEAVARARREREKQLTRERVRRFRARMRETANVS